MKGLLRSMLVLAVATLAMLAATLIPLTGSKSVLASAYTTQVGISWPHDVLSSGPLQAEAVLSGSVDVASLGTTSSDTDPGAPCASILCVLRNVQASGGNPPGTRPVNETPIAANPVNGKALLTGGNDYNCLTPTRSLPAGFYITGNAGRTWKSICMGTLAGECGAGDPGVGYDLNGVAYITGLNVSCSTRKLNQITIQHSTDNGSTWSTPVVAVTPLLPGGDVDKDWLEVDTNRTSRYRNALYISTSQFGQANSSEIAVSHSTDGGATWTTTAVDPVQTFPLVDQFSDLAIGKDGTVYVSWMRCLATGPTGDCGGSTATFYVSRSTNGGTTWSTPSPIATVHLAPDTCGAFYGCLPNTKERVSNIPVIDATHAHGKGPESLYVAFYNWTGTFMQVEVVTSNDGGKKWSKPVNVAPKTNTHDQFFPWLSVSEDGDVGVTWLDRRNDPANVSYEAFAAVSKGWLNFGKNVKIAEKPSNPNNDGFQGRFMGDYTGNSWSDGILYASWMDSRNGVNMQDEVGGVRLK